MCRLLLGKAEVVSVQIDFCLPCWRRDIAWLQKLRRVTHARKHSKISIYDGRRPRNALSHVHQSARNKLNSFQFANSWTLFGTLTAGRGVYKFALPLTSHTDQLDTRIRCLPPFPFSGTGFSIVLLPKYPTSTGYPRWRPLKRKRQ